MKKKIGIVGCGVIGTAVSKAIKEKFSEKAELVAVYDVVRNKAEKLGKLVPIEELVSLVDIVVESASPDAVKQIAPLVMANNKKMLVLSTGGLLNIPLQKGIFFPSGAIAGLDALSAASLGRIDKITLTTTKPPEALGDKKYDKDTVVFSGTVDEAIEKFPKNINVCATLALVSKKPELITVKIIASPSIKRNTHKVDIEGDFGHMILHIENEPSPDNPKTSHLAVLSAIDTLRKILNG